MNIQDLIIDYESLGCIHTPKALGFAVMPDGYALMLNADETHYFWVSEDGRESCIDWDKWRVYRGAKADKGGREK